MIRINKFIAECGLASRRGADALIAEGVVKVNGKVLQELGLMIDPEKDEVTVRGKRIGKHDQRMRYIAVYKPSGYTSTVRDPFAEKTVLDLFTAKERIYPVGRLDKESEGLMFLTNDGEFALHLTHPRYHVAKKYHVLVVGKVSEVVLQQLREGIELEEGVVKAKVSQLGVEHGRVWLEIVLQEGKKRQIRRMCAAVHLHVEKLVRVAIGNVSVEGLKPGAWRELNNKEVESLLR